MKKLLSIFLFLCALPAFCAEPLLLINPFRETFVNFPTSTLQSEGLAVTIFLPEPALPLRQKYPVVYVLGVGPKDAEAARALLENSAQKAILVGVNLTEENMQDVEKVADFISRELVLYIDANYPTLAEASQRGIAAQGAGGGKVLAALLAKKNLFTKGVLLNGGHWPVSLAVADENMRLLLAGNRNNASVWAQTLQDSQKDFGPDFAVKLTEEKSLLAVIDLGYLWADAARLMPKKFTARVTPDHLSLSAKQPAYLAVSATLANGQVFDFMALDIRLSPHYLNYDAESGALTAIPGAQPGKVKISQNVGKKKFSTKIRLKK
ncbi:hypothetical protein [Candidatus Avelusimicrobium sp.]